MSNLGLFKEQFEGDIAKFLDSLIDFNEVMKNQKKVLGLFSIGAFLERYDRKMFKYGIAVLDDNLLGKNASPEAIKAVEDALNYLRLKDVNGFLNHVAAIMADKIQTPFEGYDRQLFQSVLGLFASLVGKAIEAIEKKLAEAEEEK